MRRIIKGLSILAILTLVCILTGCQGKKDEAEPEFETVLEDEVQTAKGENAECEEESGSTSIYVHVCGQVAAPGVYELAKESRLYEAIEAAGGMTKEAAAEYLNQAQPLEDGQKVYVPSEKEVEGTKEAQESLQEDAGSSGADDGKVDLNRASKEELMTLSGIGEVKAEAIISYREEHGGFQSIEELKNIEGIKDGVFKKVKDRIKV